MGKNRCRARVTGNRCKRLLEEYDISRVKAVAWGNKWKKRGEALKISEYFLFYFAIPAEVQCLHEYIKD